MNLRRKLFLKTQTCLRTVFSIPYPWDKVTSPSDRCSDSRIDAGSYGKVPKNVRKEAHYAAV